ncbi:MAG: nucleoid occlusion factor SlmA [Gammaproteobacteria bacterium]|nr:nucleoid occlusion factor SlmA [Gammaproteobacteria bacterium]
MVETATTTNTKPSRRQHILETLALELEHSPGERITTAGLAKAVGVSEAALYRHFPSKAKMFEGLIEFIETSVFGLITRILQEEKRAAKRCEKISTLILGFSQKNPGITRLMTGDVLTGETERLRLRIDKFYERVETQLKQVLREGELAQECQLGQHLAVFANLLLASIEGRMQQFVRSGFVVQPLVQWEQQWQMLARCLN